LKFKPIKTKGDFVRLTKEQSLKVEEYLLNGISSNDTQLNTAEEKLKFAYNRFKAEYGFNILRMGEYKAFSEWLSGLALDYDFYNYKILELAKEWGQNPTTEAQENKIIMGWWDFLTTKFFKALKKYKVV